MSKIGTLSLFQKRGLFYREEPLFSEDRFSKLEGEIANPEFFPKSVASLPHRHQVAIVDENGNTDFVRALYKDSASQQYPYEITVWLLVEEE